MGGEGKQGSKGRLFGCEAEKKDAFNGKIHFFKLLVPFSFLLLFLLLLIVFFLVSSWLCVFNNLQRPSYAVNMCADLRVNKCAFLLLF